MAEFSGHYSPGAQNPPYQAGKDWIVSFTVDSSWPWEKVPDNAISHALLESMDVVKWPWIISEVCCSGKDTLILSSHETMS